MRQEALHRGKDEAGVGMNDQSFADKIRARLVNSDNAAAVKHLLYGEGIVVLAVSVNHFILQELPSSPQLRRRGSTLPLRRGRGRTASGRDP